MNVLPRDQQIAVIAALSEGASIRSTERLIGVHRDTIMRLGARVGHGCEILMHEMMQGLSSPLIELDELWSYVGKKQRRLKSTDGTDKGDQYVFIALDSLRKAIISYRVGKRDGDTTMEFARDLRRRVVGSPQVNTDAFAAYERCIETAFGLRVHHGMIHKSYRGEPPVTATRRYSPGWVVAVAKRRVAGEPVEELISTSYVERQNLSVRMASRRFTRLTNGFSKKLDNHVAAVGLYVAHYNLCRPHMALATKGQAPTTPAMALGLTDHVWSIAELIDAALSAGNDGDPLTLAPILPSMAGRPRFAVIQGGRK